MVLISLCILYEEPHRPKDFADHKKTDSWLLPEGLILPLSAVLWLTGGENNDLSSIRTRFLNLCTSNGLAGSIFPYISTYFQPLCPFLERLRMMLFGNHSWGVGRYLSPSTEPTHAQFRTILVQAMTDIPKDNKDFASLMPDPIGIYPPINEEGRWTGEIFDGINPPLQSNNTFSYSVVSAKTPISTSMVSVHPSVNNSEITVASSEFSTFVTTADTTEGLPSTTSSAVGDAARVTKRRRRKRRPSPEKQPTGPSDQVYSRIPVVCRSSIATRIGKLGARTGPKERPKPYTRKGKEKGKPYSIFDPQSLRNRRRGYDRA